MRTRKIVVIACATATIVLTGAAWSGVRLNTTPSMPLGLWMVARKSTSRDAFVIACLSGPEATEAEDRGYLGIGSCPDRVEPVVKPVAAVAGDVVTVTPSGIIVNGSALPRTTPLAKDSAGRLLQAFPAGTYHVAPGTVWLLSGHDPRSFDSRYFGPIPVAVIRSVVEPLVTFR